MTNAIFFDGAVKAKVDDLPAEAWTVLSGGQASTEQDHFQAVPWLYRGVGLRADALGSLPFAILKGESEIDTSDDYQNKVEFLPDPMRLFGLIEASITCLGKSYLFNGYNLMRTVELRYLSPTSVSPVWNKDTGELAGFTRNVNGVQVPLAVEDVIHFWMADPFVEQGPPKAYPLKAALLAAGVLFNVDRFAAAFFERGAIKPTILTAPQLRPGSPEAKKLKAWWQRITAGINRAFAAEVAATELKAEIIGEGIKELENTALTGEKREDISTALGIPQTLLFSQAANYATAQEDRLSFYKETIVPEARFIESALNTQLFEPQGLKLVFRPETLDVFQKDEQVRSMAFVNYKNAGLPINVIGPMLGIELPAGFDWDQLQDEVDERRDQMQEQLGGGGGFAQSSDDENAEDEAEGKGLSAEAIADLKKWAKKAKSRGGYAPFESKHIPLDLHELADKSLADFPPDAVFGFLKQGGLDAAEQRIKVKVQTILGKWRKKFITIISNNGVPPYDELRKELQAALGPEIANIATEQALATAATIGVEFDSAVVNSAALAWASRWTYEVISGIDNTTRQVVQKAMAAYTETPGMTRGQLEELLQHAFNEYRASMIAVTETTRAYAMAMNQYQEMLSHEGLKMERIWQTNNDELVCPICGPLNQQPEKRWSADFPDGPPAHVNCRCFLTLKYRGRV